MAGFYRTTVIDTVVESTPAEYLRRPRVPPESPTLGLTHLQFEALLTAARVSPNRSDFALVAMLGLLGLLGLPIFEACALDVADLREEHGHRVLRVLGKGGRIVLVPLPPAVGRAVDAAIGDRASGPILLNARGARALMNALGRSGQSDRALGDVRVARIWSRMSARTASSLRSRYTVAVVLRWMIAVITRASVEATAASTDPPRETGPARSSSRHAGRARPFTSVGLDRLAEDELVQVRSSVLDLLSHARRDRTDESDNPFQRTLPSDRTRGRKA